MDSSADRRDAAARRARLDARDRGLSRASSVTARVAVGSVAATIAAATVFAQSSPPLETAPPAVAPGAVVSDSVGRAGTVATGGDGLAPHPAGPTRSHDRATQLQPPDTAPTLVTGRHHHATSAPS